jgi:uncharacterized membrane protein
MQRLRPASTSLRASEAPRTASTFLAVHCATPAGAEEALSAVHGLGKAIEDAAVVIRTADGRVELRQTREVAAGEGIVAGGTAGMVAGLLLGGPIGGALLGMLGGGIYGAIDTGIPNERMQELGKKLSPGSALLCALVRSDAADRARELLAGYGEVAEAEPPAGVP